MRPRPRRFRTDQRSVCSAVSPPPPPTPQGMSRSAPARPTTPQTSHHPTRSFPRYFATPNWVYRSEPTPVQVLGWLVRNTIPSLGEATNESADDGVASEIDWAND